MTPDYIPKLSEPARVWLRFGLLVVGLAVLGWITYRLRLVFSPLLVAAALAYILNPAVTWLERRWGVQRLTTVVVVFVLAGGVLISGGFYLYSGLVGQLQQLEQNLPEYADAFSRWTQPYRSRVTDVLRPPASQTALSVAPPVAALPLEGSGTAAPVPTSQPSGPQSWRVALGLIRDYGAAVGGRALEYLRAAFSNILDLLSLLILVPMFTFYFLWRFNEGIAAIRNHLPAAYRPGIVHVARTIDLAMADFFRGRLLVCMAVGIMSAIGWSLIGLPYSVPLGLLAGALNLVPFMALLTLPPALLLAYLKVAGTDASWVGPVVLTMAVFVAVQALDSFVLSPLIYGRSSGLHPLIIVVALLIGAEIAGLPGLLLAIPVASTLRTLGHELVLPELRRLAGHASAAAEEEPDEPSVEVSGRASL